MTIPFTPEGENTSPEVASFDGLVVGAAFSALNNRTESAIRDQINSSLLDVDGDSVWATLWDVFWGFIKQPIEWVIEVFKTLFPWVDWENLPETFEDILEWIKDALYAIPFFGDFLQGAETFVQALLRNVIEFFTDPGEGLLNALKALLGTAGGLIDTIISSIVYWLTHPGALLTGLIDALKTLFGNAGELIETVINSIIYWLTNPGQPGGIGYLLIEAMKTLFTNVGPIIETIIDSIIYFFTHPGEIATKLLDALKDLFGNTGELIETVIDSIAYWMGQVGTLATALIDAVIDWLKNFGGIDLTGTFSFIQVIIDSVARFFGQTGETLWAWANGLVTLTNLGTLIQGMFSSIFATFPISMVGSQEKLNLLNLGQFQTSSSLEGSAGWSWDSSKNRTGGSGGTAKVDCAYASGVKNLFCNQNIRVAEGDKIAVSAFVNTLSFNGSGTSIQLVLIPFSGAAAGFEQVLVSRGASNNAWVEMTNESAPYVVPDSVTSVQLALRVNASATAGTVWWDDITLWKTGLMQQGLVEYLISAWNGLIGGLGVGQYGSATPANTTDPWNFTLQAGAGAKGQAWTATGAASAAAGAASTADGKAVVADGKAVTADGKAVTADGKAVTADGKAVTADGKAVTAQSAAEAAAGAASGAAGVASAAQGAATSAAGAASAAGSAAALADSLATLAGVANNLVVSPDCDDVGVRRYQTTGYSVVYSTEQARSGNSLKVTVTTSGQANLQFYLSPVLSSGALLRYAVTPGQVYKYDLFIMAKSTNSGSGAMGLNFALYNVEGGGSTIAATNLTPVKGTWQRFSGSYTIPASTGSPSGEPYLMMPQFFVTSPVINDVYYIDRILIYR